MSDRFAGPGNNNNPLSDCLYTGLGNWWDMYN